jgi:hypothetical protein
MTTFHSLLTSFFKYRPMYKYAKFDLTTPKIPSPNAETIPQDHAARARASSQPPQPNATDNLSCNKLCAIFVDLRWFTSIYVNFRRFSSFFANCRRLSSIFVDFCRFLLIFVDFRQF